MKMNSLFVSHHRDKWRDKRFYTGSFIDILEMHSKWLVSSWFSKYLPTIASNPNFPRVVEIGYGCGWWWYDGMYNIVWTALMSAQSRVNVCLHDTHSKYPDFHQPRKPLVQGSANLCRCSRSRNAFIMWCTSVKVSILNLDRECKCLAGSRAAHCRTAELCSAAVAVAVAHTLQSYCMQHQPNLGVIPEI